MDKRGLHSTNADGNMECTKETSVVVSEEVPNGTENEIPVTESNKEDSYLSAQMQSIFFLKIDEVWETSLPVAALVDEICQFPYEDVSHKAELAQFHTFFHNIWQKIDAKMKDCQINDEEFSRDPVFFNKSFYADGLERQEKNAKESIVFPFGYPKMDDEMITEANNFMVQNNESGDKTNDLVVTLKPGGMVDSDVVLKEMTLIRERSENYKGLLPSVYFLQPDVFSWLHRLGVDDALDIGYDVYDLFTSDLVIFPLHFDEGKWHWALAVADFRVSETIIITYYDSILNRRDTGQKERGDKSLKLLQRYLEAASVKSGIIGDISRKKFCLKICEDTPQQHNDIDCGVFILKIADYLTSGLDLNFQQKHIPYFRRVIAWEIKRKRLLWIPQQAKVDSADDGSS